MISENQALRQLFLKDESRQKCGCYIKNIGDDFIGHEALMVPLRHIDYELEIANALVNTTLIQQYYNPSEKFLQVDFSFPINPQAAIYKFWAEFDGVRIEGIIKEKEEAKKQFQEAKKEGRKAVLGSIDPHSKDVMNLEIGNIPPKTQFTLTISFMQEMTLSMNTFYKAHIPYTVYPRYASNFFDMLDKDKKNLPKVKGNFTWNFKINLKTQKKVIFFDSPSHDLTLLSQNQPGTQSLLAMSQASRPNKDFIFLYTTEDFQIPSYVLGTTDVSSTVMLSIIPKFCSLAIDDAYKASIANKVIETDINSAKGDYVFLLDRSGSMSGSRIQKAKQALTIFLQSLPEDSYFNIVSFGSSEQKLFNSSKKYNKNSLNEAIQKVKPMTANLGGTEIYYPLEKILKEKINPGYPKQIFLLTDGGVSNTQGVLRMIEKNTKYARVHSIGIGDGASQSLIEGSAKNGKGKSIMISDHQNPSDKIIELLQTSLTPLISQISLKFEDDLVESIVPNPKSIPYILKNDLANFYVTFKKPLVQTTSFVFEYKDTVTNHLYSSKISVVPSDLNEPFVDKMGHLKVIKNLEKMAHDESLKVQDYMHYVKVKDFKKDAIAQSIRHQVLSEFTSFLCVQKKLVDGQYQQFKAKGVQTIQVEQPEIEQYIVILCQSVELFLFLNYERFYFIFLGHFLQQLRYQTLTRQYDRSMNRAMPKCAMPMSAKRSRKAPQKCAEESTGIFDKLRNFLPSFGSKKQSQECCSIKKHSVQNNRIQMLCSGFEVKQDCDFSKQSQVIPSLEKHSKQLSSTGKIKDVISCQNINGSWSNKDLIISLSNDPERVKTLMKKYGVDLVLTYLASEWIQKNYPQKQYVLVIKKARSWIQKQLEQNKLKIQVLEQLKNCI